MTRRFDRTRCVVLPGLVLAAHLTSATVAWTNDRPVDDRWIALQQQSREALATLTARDGGSTEPGIRTAPRLVVVGFTGGREGADSPISGVVRLRRHVEQSMTHRDDVLVMTYNNRDWSMAADAVAARMTAPAPASPPTAAHLDAPQRALVVVFGHSWGGGAITKFARRLGDRDIDVALAVYVDAFALRDPRVPANVHYAVNLYQRSGIFRGLPLRGKGKLVVEDSAATTVLANLQIKPQTDRYFGWHWNLVQPLLYLHHHRMGHDVRLHRYLIALIENQIEDLPPLSSAPSAIDEDSWRADDTAATPAAATIGS